MPLKALVLKLAQLGRRFKRMSPMRIIQDPSALFPGLYDHSISLSRLDWKWGDIDSDQGLLLLCLLAASGYTPIVEFGTYRGRTTYNLARNLREGKMVTIDGGASIADGTNLEKRHYGPYVPGEVFLEAKDEKVRRRIQLMQGDSRHLDLSRLYGTIGLVFVDGGHSYDVCRNDSEKALRLVRPGGVIVWDDYGVYWPGVQRVLDDLANRVPMYYLPREKMAIHICPGRESNSPAVENVNGI